MTGRVVCTTEVDSRTMGITHQHIPIRCWNHHFGNNLVLPHHATVRVDGMLMFDPRLRLVGFSDLRDLIASEARTRPRGLIRVTY